MARRAIGGKRCHLVLSTVQERRLEQLSRKTGLTVSEHIRRAIDAYFRLLDAADARARKD